MTTGTEFVRGAFEAWSGGEPGVVAAAPGRVNLIGEHTDYNEGFVLPMAIERATVVAARRREDMVLRVLALNHGRQVSVRVKDKFSFRLDDHWANFVLGVLEVLRRARFKPAGADMLIAGDVPEGCGLSSSASLTMAVLKAFEALGGFSLDGPRAARLGQRVENDFVMVDCGIMDPFVVRMAKEGHAVLLDCRSLDFEHIPAVLEDAVFVIANTGVTRGLSGSEYNKRVAECRKAVRTLRKITRKDGASLRDFALEDLDAARETMGPVPFRRARHVLSENARTLEAADALRAGDAHALGELMNASHDSLRGDYEVSCPELDAMAAIGQGHPACLGARMTGAGFGGCTVHLVQRAAVDAYAAHLVSEYGKATGITADIIVSHAAAGARVTG